MMPEKWLVMFTKSDGWMSWKVADLPSGWGLAQVSAECLFIFDAYSESEAMTLAYEEVGDDFGN